jgi:hypothetical protein
MEMDVPLDRPNFPYHHTDPLRRMDEVSFADIPFI